MSTDVTLSYAKSIKNTRTFRFLGIPFLDEAKMHADAREMLKGLGISIPDTRLLVRNLSGGQPSPYISRK